MWDVDGGGACLHTYRHHKGKVQAVAWNPVEASVLAAASFDGTASVTDARAPDAGRVGRYALPADVEALAWNLHAPFALLASMEDGGVVAYDVRAPSAPLWRLRAHGAACTSLSLSARAPGLLATASLDKSVKVR